MGTKSKSFALVIVALFLISLVTLQNATVKASTTTIVVPDDYPTIQEAIDNANSGDTVFVRNGIYYTDAYSGGDGLTIGKSISVIGEDSQKTILKPDWQGRYAPYAGILIKADKVTISGFTINGASDNATFGAFFFDTPTKGYQQVGIRITSNASGNKIANNILLNNAFYQIEDSGDSSVIIGNNITSDNSIRSPYDDGGISLNSSNTLVLNNTISQLGFFGITVRNSQNITIEDNKITGNGVNHIFHSEKDIGGLELANIGNGSVHVYRNNITDNFGSGVNFDQSNNCTLYNNNINGNNNGIYLKNYILSTSNSRLGTGNILYSNNLIDNEKSVVIEYNYYYLAGLNNSGVIGNATSQVLWDNGAIGNYWSDYKGNGTYVIDENNIDHYPLTQQVDISSIVPTPTTNQPNAVLILPIAATVVIIAVIVSLLFYTRHRKKSLKTN